MSETVPLFSYGTLVLQRVQREVLGRTVEMSPDSLNGYRRDRVHLGDGTYYIAVRDEAGAIDGMALKIDAADLPQLDEYETDAYQRVLVTLRSGREACLYCKPE
jgi:gamma-glutamylcyclotransferase (GGCT)/AIG2-like uncharacterized protein YtfP